MRMGWLFGRNNVRAPWIVALLVLLNALLLRALDPSELGRLRSSSPRYSESFTGASA